MIMNSEKAAHGWSKPIRLLWIDGDHRYEPAQLDFKLWEPFVVEGGIIAMHDTIRKKVPREFCGKMSSAQIVSKTSPSSITSRR